ncbi:hypothetical protein OQZ33_02275 [Pedobacter sp. MC2016-05]|uniref:hypothetical protein n=1 Tax=Pedobacter sp. MC2016-05 TaxID=2994474 RepID=UPI0022470610|nr:hypothetical protein [Pedobacter sp. MC2016-05]MCX2473149.1 hypothetical protein [Pedobacter sp. MC2016-05]
MNLAKLCKIFTLTFIILFSVRVFAQRKIINIQSELGAIINLSDLPQYTDAVVKQFSSYDTTGNNDDGFSGKYSFIRKTADGSSGCF